MNYQKLANSNSLLLLVALALIATSLIVPRLNAVGTTDSALVFDKPTDTKLVELSQPIIDALDNSGNDGLELAKLYRDLAKLIDITDIIKNTEEIREANRISGKILDLNLKDKYPGLADAANNLVVSYIGDDNVILSPELRQKSSEAFRALAWACSEGSK
jgi:hypothetical protein